MPLAISNILWPAALDDRAVALARQSGADGIEVAPTRIAPWDELKKPALRAYRERLNAMGLAIPALQAILFGRADVQLLADEQSYRRLAEHIAVVAEYAAEMGATRMVFGAPKNRTRGPLSSAEAMKLAAERLRPIAEQVHGQGVSLVIEAVPPVYGCDFVNTAAEAAALVRQVDHAGVRLHLDAGALAIAQEEPDEIVGANADILAHVHVSRPGLAAVGEPLPLDRALATALARASYGGWISIEISPQDDPLPCLRRALETTRAAYETVL